MVATNKSEESSDAGQKKPGKMKLVETGHQWKEELRILSRRNVSLLDVLDVGRLEEGRQSRHSPHALPASMNLSREVAMLSTILDTILMCFDFTELFEHSL